ncbi:MAG: carbohydrate ABC transporter permease [Chloroflexi bacterium]|nr:carbohydrate ABC transporter permease [Chloroflexota bacterium]
MNRDKLKSRIANLLIHAVLISGALFMLFPFVWMILGSLQTFAETTTGTFLPAEPKFSNYGDAVVAMNGMKPCNFDPTAPFDILSREKGCTIVRYFFNTIFMGFGTVLGVLFTATLAGYAFARLQFPGKNLIFTILLATMMIPGELTLIPNYVFMVWFPTPESWIGTLLNIPGVEPHNWIDTYYALIIPWIATVFSIFLFRQFFRGIPNELFDAALLDGATHSRFLVSVVLPLSKPVLITSALLTFLGSWNSLMWPLLVTNSPEMRPIQVGLRSLITEAGTQTQLLLAGATVTVIPIILVYLVLQRWFVEGISNVGIRG